MEVALAILLAIGVIGCFMMFLILCGLKVEESRDEISDNTETQTDIKVIREDDEP